MPDPDKFPTISLKSDDIMGIDTHIFLDGTELQGVTGIKIESSARGFNTVQITMIAKLEIDLKGMTSLSIGGETYRLEKI